MSTHVFQCESTLLYRCLNVKELLARNRRDIGNLRDFNGTRTHNHLVRKWTLNQLAKLAKLSGCGFEPRCSHLKYQSSLAIPPPSDDSDYRNHPKSEEWFSDNQTQGNTGKCYLILHRNEPVQIQIGESLIESTNCEKILGVKIYPRLWFDKHVKTIRKKKQVIKVLARVTLYMMTIEKKKVLMNSFFDFQFSYLPLVWMCHSRRNTTNIDNLHER